MCSSICGTISKKRKRMRNRNAFSLHWLQEKAKSDPEIRALHHFLKSIKYEYEKACGYHGWKRVLYEIEATSGWHVLLSDAYHQWCFENNIAKH